MNTTQHISPTGNAKFDTATLLHAIDRLTETNFKTSKSPGCIKLTGGDYRINQQLVFGAFDQDVLPPVLIAPHNAHFTWEGDKIDDSMIVYHGHSFYTAAPYLVNLVLWCNRKCRGIRVHDVSYISEMRSVGIWNPRQVGIDVVDSWGSVIRDTWVKSADGICMRLHQFNSAMLQNIRLSTYSLADMDLPPVDEKVVPCNSNGWVQTDERNRAALTIQTGNQLTADNVLMEGASFREHGSGISLHNYRMADFRQVRWEGSNLQDQQVLVSGASRDIHFDGMGPGTGCKCSVRAIGDNRNITVRDVWTRGQDDITDGILICDGGKHAGHRVSRVSPEYPMDRYIVEQDSPTMSGKAKADTDHSVSIPWQ